MTTDNPRCHCGGPITKVFLETGQCPHNGWTEPLWPPEKPQPVKQPFDPVYLRALAAEEVAEAAARALDAAPLLALLEEADLFLNEWGAAGNREAGKLSRRVRRVLREWKPQKKKASRG